MEKFYIGTKLVKADRALKFTFPDGKYVFYYGDGDESEMEAEDRLMASKIESGYRVEYEDGYTSWSPADVFEKAYLPMTVNSHLRTDKPSVSQEMVDNFIAETHVQTIGDKTTLVRAVLVNGFEIVEASACVSAENYDEAYGAKICLGKIKDKIWYLLGFLLQTAVSGVKAPEEATER